MRYKHNCTDCVDLGECENYDLYICQDINDEHHIHLIARFGDLERDFICCTTLDEIHDTPLDEAKERAIKQGYLAPDDQFGYVFVKK